MNSRIRTTGLLALVSTIAAPIICWFLKMDAAIIILSIFIVIGFFTVIFVGVIGSLEDEAHPQTANDSAAVNAWKLRMGEAPASPEASESAS